MEYSEIPLLDFAFAARGPKNAGLNLTANAFIYFWGEESDSNMEIYASRSDCGNLFILFRIFANGISHSFFLRGSGAKNSVSLSGICPDFI